RQSPCYFTHSRTTSLPTTTTSTLNFSQDTQPFNKPAIVSECRIHDRPLEAFRTCEKQSKPISQYQNRGSNMTHDNSLSQSLKPKHDPPLDSGYLQRGDERKEALVYFSDAWIIDNKRSNT